ncbi:hypothetical protein [Brachybacterium sp. GPGPB12]|uniref:hypothetical protein n=1 Tax=Brachybacterium sp. GPGPB12 TaxID=3023517 RepID=UPI00313450F7
MSDQRGEAGTGSPADPDLEGTVRGTPSEWAPTDHRPGDAEGAGPVGSGEDLPEDDTVSREEPPREADGNALVHEVPLSDSDDDTVVRRPGGGLFDHSPGGRPFLPDTGPIQRFDQRPRFEYPAASTASGRRSPTSPTRQSPAPPAEPSSARPGGAPSATPSAARSTGTPPPVARPQGSPSQGARPADGSPSVSAPAPPGAPPGIDATGPRRRGLLVPAIAFGRKAAPVAGRGRRPDRGVARQPRGRADPRRGVLERPAQAEPGVWRAARGGAAAHRHRRRPRAGPRREPAAGGDAAGPHRLRAAADRRRRTRTGGADRISRDRGRLPRGQLGRGARRGRGRVHRSRRRRLQRRCAPEDSACDPARFSEATPVVCQADNTLYWPAAWDPGFSNTAAEEVPRLYMWHLSYSYALFAMSAVSLDDYFGTPLISLAEEPERAEESQRRYDLQVSCLASAAVYRMPEGIRPADRVESFVTSVDAQAAPATAGEPSPEARAVWVGQGKGSEGVAARGCDTWSAAPDAVA